MIFTRAGETGEDSETRPVLKDGISMLSGASKSVPPFIRWQDECSVNSEIIDEQHRGLISLINDLYEAVRSGDPSSLSILFERLEAYTRTHFATEERLLRECDYKDYESHKRYHEWMVQRTVALRSSFQPRDREVSHEMLSFLKNWWLRHILRIDKQYASNLLAKHRGKLTKRMPFM